MGVALGSLGEPTRRLILDAHVSTVRNGLVARSLMEKIMNKYGRRVVFLTDGGSWYPRAIPGWGARWRWVRGCVRSFVER